MRGALRDLLGAAGGPLEPALIPIPAAGSRSRRRTPEGTEPPVHFAFGRGRKDKADGADEEGEEEAAEDAADGDQVPPIPSALGASEPDADAPEETEAVDSAASWRPLEASAVLGGEEDEDDTEPEGLQPNWMAQPDDDDSGGAAAESAPWSPVGSDERPPFNPSLVDPAPESAETVSWLQSEPANEAAPWSVASDSPGAEAEADPDDFTARAADLADVDEIEPETPVEDEEPLAGTESFAEILTVTEEPWASPAPVAEEPMIFPATPGLPPIALSADVPSLQTRSFPLPEGEVVFRNLRAGFTDPARLLRHLAGEGHTGVLHVLGVDGSNSYVVLVDGYVVAVATDRQGSITTTNRISFPNFPNSQDTINVITYSRQIARGLGLLLHAPVRFAGLGAMFVNLEGLRSYLSKYSSSGGLIVHAQEGIGVALFEDGKLVGAYANGNAPTADLGQLRDLVKDLEAEIDVRFGGPQELEPTPLDTLLSGHPL
ncbi:MAG TPA: hypothetical protein VI138_04240 [Candidatus Dormibacteraeota bacterium]